MDGQDNTYTLPAPIAGSSLDLCMLEEPQMQQMLLLLHQEIQTFHWWNYSLRYKCRQCNCFSDGNSNSSVQLNVPQAFDITIVGKDTTNYQIFGTVTSTTVPCLC